MGVIGKCFRFLSKRLFELSLTFLMVVYMPGLPPEGNFTSNIITPAKPLDGKYTLNAYMNNADHLYVNKVRGAESFAEWNGELYSGVHGGDIVKLLPNGEVVSVAKIGKPCDGYWQESKCGRPLGIAFDKTGLLYVMDAYYGIWTVNLKNDVKHLLVSPKDEIEGRKPMLFNSIALASNGDFYWTDSSSDIILENGVFGMLLDGSGRLMHYDAVKKSSRVLLDGLWFANGVVLSPNEDFVVVSETTRSQLRRYYLKGDKKGTDDIFIDGLPGLPDNLHSSADGILMPLVSPRDADHPMIFQSIAPHPLLRKFIVRMIALVQLPFKAVQKIMPHYVFERTAHWIGHFESVQALVPKRTTLVKLDWVGNVVDSWHCLDGSLTGISEAYVYKNNFYLGSPYNTYIGRVPLPEKFVQSILSSTTAPPPRTITTTTTPKPTTAPPPTQPPTTKPPPTTTPPPTQPPTTKPPPTTTPPPTQPPTTKPPVTQPPTTKPPPTKPPTTTPKPTAAPKPQPLKPVVENIPTDTKPPPKEDLKVITKEGPSVIPAPDKASQKPKTEL